MQRIRTTWGAAVVFALIALAGALAHLTVPYARSSERLGAEEVENAKESIALSLLGQVQFTVGSLMWLKTMEYLHNGVPYRMPTNVEEEHGQRATNSTGTNEGLAHQEGVPMALTRKTDWRGIVGDVHREIQPYLTEHRHSDPRELIPWYRFATRFNPNLERLYVMGAFFMSDFAKEPQEALEYLLRGVKANPWSFEIHAALGRLYYDAFSDYEKAVDALQKATKYGMEEQDRLSANKEHFDDYQKQLLRESYLFLAKSLTELGRFDEATQVCDDGFAATNHNHLKIQKRIIEKRKNGESPSDSEPKTSQHDETDGTIRSGVKEVQTDYDEEYAEEDDEQEDIQRESVGEPSLLVGCGATGVVGLGVVLHLRRKRHRAMPPRQRRVPRIGKRPMLIGAIVLVLVGLGTAFLGFRSRSEPSFESPRLEALYYRDRIGNRHVQMARNVVDAGNAAWDNAEQSAQSGRTDESEGLYRRSTAYYRAAHEVVRKVKHARTLTFPNERSLGKISTRDWGSKDRWEELGEAKGEVCIPAGHEMDLAVRTDIAPDEMEFLPQLGPASIQSLNCGQTQVGDAHLAYVQELVGLRDLSLYGTGIGDQALMRVVCIPTLQTLNIGGTQISDAGVECLAQLPHLNVLNLANSAVTGAGMAAVGRITSLRVLWLTGLSIDDKGLASLKTLPNLRILWIGNTPNQVTDAGLSELAQLKTLKELWIGSTRVTERGLRDLKKALPGCRIQDLP